MEEKEKNSTKLSANNASFGFFVGFLLCQLSAIIVILLANSIGIIFDITNENLELFFNNCYGYLILTLATDFVMFAIFFFGSKGKNNKVISKPTISKILIYFSLAVLAHFVLSPAIICLDTLFKNIGLTPTEIPYNLTGKSFVASIFSLALVPAICEELLFRGFIQKSLQKYGRTFSIVLTTLMFAIFHMSFDQLAYPILFGLLLSVIMDKENNILYCILAHATNNLLSIISAYLNINFVFNHWSYILFAVVLVIVYLIAMIVILAKTVKKEEKTKLTKREIVYLSLSFAIMIILWIIINITA